MWVHMEGLWQEACETAERAVDSQWSLCHTWGLHLPKDKLPPDSIRGGEGQHTACAGKLQAVPGTYRQHSLPTC